MQPLFRDYVKQIAKYSNLRSVFAFIVRFMVLIFAYSKGTNNESEETIMKKSNVIDLQNYFAEMQQAQQKQQDAMTVQKIIHAAGRVLDVASSVAIAGCLCACLLLFFTML